LEQQRELAAIQLGQQACRGQGPSPVAECIQQVYDTLTVATNTDGSRMLVGENYNFNYTTVSINGEGIDPQQLGCATARQQTRCGVFDSVHFHDDDDKALLSGYSLGRPFQPVEDKHDNAWLNQERFELKRAGLASFCLSSG
jgi:hypothetical protein